jgi:hypothetical protein
MSGRLSEGRSLNAEQGLDGVTSITQYAATGKARCKGSWVKARAKQLDKVETAPLRVRARVEPWSTAATLGRATSHVGAQRRQKYPPSTLRASRGVKDDSTDGAVR